MNWTELKQPTKGICFYDHIDCKTPLGLIRIEWKSWKQNDDYSVSLDDNWIRSEYTLESAKEWSRQYLEDKYEALKTYLNK